MSPLARSIRGVLWLMVAAALLSGALFAWSFWNVSRYQNTQFTGKADCGVIFGAAVWRDSLPSPALSDRIQAGIGLYKNNQVTCLVLSGGPSTYGAHEVDSMADVLQQYNIPLKDIERDYEGLNTLATLKNLPPDDRTYVMISQGTHLGRIRLLSQKVGLGVVPIHAADPIRWQRSGYDELFWNEVGKSIYYLFLPNTTRMEISSTDA